MESMEVKKMGDDLLLHAIVHGNTQDAIALLEDRECEVNGRNINGHTPLFYAVKNQHLTFVNILLKYGADPNIAENGDVGGNTPLHIACDLNQVEICKELLSVGADPSLKNGLEFTPLHLSARKGYKEVVKLLLTKGVDPDILDKYKNSASYYAKEKGHLDVLALLPPPRTPTIEDFYEYKTQVASVLGTEKKKSKKKKKKKKK